MWKMDQCLSSLKIETHKTSKKTAKILIMHFFKIQFQKMINP